jgi:selenocysteine lyase/cysteine desulfurase
VALVLNFSYGFNTLLEGLEKPKKALLIKNDYPSINWPVESRNFECFYTEIDAHLEDNIRTALKAHQPDFFAFSIVQYINGVKLSIDFLKELKKEFPGTIFIADGTQFLGTEIFDFDSTGIDVVISSSYKWLNGGYGNGFILFNENIVGKIQPKHLGFGSLQGKYKAHEGNFIGKFEPGHQDTLNHGSLSVALKLLRDTGMENIEAQVNKLKDFAKEKFSELGLLEDFVVKRNEHSSIYNIKGDHELFKSLRKANIIISQRGEGIRVSFHFFNTVEEVEKLLDALKTRR